jgi:APA family basic amino acid/polyamine antiporter
LSEAQPALVRTIGRWSLVALMLNSIIGAGIFGLPAVLAARLGGWSLLSCVLAASVMMVFAGCIAEVSSRFDETGGLYLYARESLGQFAGLLVAWLTWLMRIAAPAAAADLFATYAAQFFPALQGRRAELIVLGVLIGQLAIVNYVGVRTGKIVSNVFTAVKSGFLVLFVVGGLLAVVLRPEIRLPLTFAEVPAKSWFEIILLMMYAYGGFEGALFVGGESSNPRRDMPIALLSALGIICALFTGAQYVVMVTLPNAGESVRPLADSAARFLGSGGAAAIGIAALVSTYGYLSANLLHAPRVTFAMARGGDFPALLGRIHPRFRTPYVSIGVYAVLLFGFAAMGNFRWNAMLSAVARLVVYAATAVALVIFRRRRGRAPFVVPGGLILAVLSLVLVVVLLSRMGSSEATVMAVVAAVALLNWANVKMRRRSPGQNGS